VNFELNIVQEQVETSVGLLFQTWRIHLFGKDSWPAELNPSEAEASLKSFLLEAVQLSRYNITAG
jgi:hypothetical protein